MRDNKIYSAAKSAICISLLVAVSYIVIPVPPSGFSLIPVMVSLIGLILTPLQAFLSILVYLLMGFIGLPVFSGGTSGPAKLFGVTGGYYFGFLLAAVAISFLKGKDCSSKRYSAVAVFLGVPLQHLCAVLMMCCHNGFDIKAAVVSISLPFILGDIIKALVSGFLGAAINKALQKNKIG